MEEIDAEAVDGRDVIDVRSEREYAEDHIPGAVNLPVLRDLERARVGTLYRESRFEARKLGAQLVSANISRLLRGPLNDKPPSFHPIVYCWRGGQRSLALALTLRQVGWHTWQLRGGYRAFRQRVLRDLDQLPSQLHFRALSGLTGTGKTRVLHELGRLGEQILDLEGLAEHQGSILGAPIGGQTVGQKRFENLVWQALRQFESNRPIWIETESAKIGKVFCPKEVVNAIRRAPRFEITADLGERVLFLNHHYHHWHEAPDLLVERIAGLTRRHGHNELDTWRTLIKQRQWNDFVERVLTVHYDPSYRRASANAASPTATLAMTDLLGEGCRRAAEKLRAMTTFPLPKQ